jgi:hypothetical protein
LCRIRRPIATANRLNARLRGPVSTQSIGSARIAFDLDPEHALQASVRVEHNVRRAVSVRAKVARSEPVIGKFGAGASRGGRVTHARSVWLSRKRPVPGLQGPSSVISRARGRPPWLPLAHRLQPQKRRRHCLVTHLWSARLKRCRRPAQSQTSSTRCQDGPMRLTEPRTGHRKVAQDSSRESRRHGQKYGSGHRFVVVRRRAAPFGHWIEPVACSELGGSLPSAPRSLLMIVATLS